MRNESDRLDSLLAELTTWCGLGDREVLLVDDGSEDETLAGWAARRRPRED